MARIGIAYSQVESAAVQLAADGKNPTVDSVREALGSTGSKSTIAPLLKRWKAEHSGNAAAAETGLPSALLHAMKGVHDKLQEDVQQQMAQADEAHRVALQMASEATRKAEDQNRLLSEDKAVLSGELQGLQERLATLQADHQMLCISLASLQSDNAGLQQRLADRAAEVAALNTQLTQSRAQFDHYAAAAVEQRAQERQAADQQVMRLEQNLAGAQQRLLQQQTLLARQETQVGHLQAQYTGLQQSAQAAQHALESCRSERDQLAFQLAGHAAAAEATARQLDTAQEAVIASRITMATQAREMALMSEQVIQTNLRLKELDRAKLDLIQEHADLRARVVYYEQRERDAIVLKD